MRSVPMRGISLVALAAVLAGGGSAVAATPIYGGGDPVLGAAIDALGQCLGVQNAANPDLTVATAGGCAAPASPAYDYLFTATSAIDGVMSLTTQTPSSSPPATGTTAVDSDFPAYPYPSWQLSVSNTPLDSPAGPGSTAYLIKAYNTSVASQRGRAWQIPIAAQAVAFPYNLPTTSFSAAGNSYSGVGFGTTFYGPAQPTVTVSGGAGGSVSVTKLDLSPDMLCYIWTQRRANGSAVTGSYAWDNPIFYGVSYRRRGNVIQTSYDSNLIRSSVAGLPILPVIVPNSGLTYVFSAWLKQNCHGYSFAGYTPASVQVTFPSFITADGLSASSSAASATLVAANPGAIGFAAPNDVAPAAVNGLPAALLLAGRVKTVNPTSNFLYPTAAAINLAVQKMSFPANFAATSWGAALDRRLFKAELSNLGYPVAGFSLLLGYTCYVNDSDNNELAGIENLIQFLTDPRAAAIIAADGLVPLPAAAYSGEAALALAKLTGVSATPVISGGSQVNGPAACPNFDTAPVDYR